MTPAEVLNACKYQPNLERRRAQLKGHQLVTPVLLKDPVRIEGLLCCHLFALIIHALIEREIRAAMKAAHRTTLPLYPELRDCAAPSAERILDIFAHVARHVLRDVDGTNFMVYDPKLTPLQLRVLELLGIPTSTYTSTKPATSQFVRYQRVNVRKGRLIGDAGMTWWGYPSNRGYLGGVPSLSSSCRGYPAEMDRPNDLINFDCFSTLRSG